MDIYEEVKSLTTLTISVIIGGLALAIATTFLIALSLFLEYLSTTFSSVYDSVSTINFVKTILTPAEIILIGYYIFLNIVDAFFIISSKSNTVNFLKNKLLNLIQKRKK